MHVSRAMSLEMVLLLRPQGECELSSAALAWPGMGQLFFPFAGLATHRCQPPTAATAPVRTRLDLFVDNFDDANGGSDAVVVVDDVAARAQYFHRLPATSMQT